MKKTGHSLSLIAFVASAALAAWGQATRPQFEVASVKPAGSRGAATLRRLPGRLTGRAPLRAFIQAAYGLEPFQIDGGPQWIGSEPYEIDAKAAGDPGRAQMFRMLQALLEDRFQLRVHRESREMPIYALAAARGGLKLPPGNAKCAEEAEELIGPLAIPGTRIPFAGAPSSGCSDLDVTIGAAGARIRGDHTSMAGFAGVLSRVLGRPVSDRTVFSGVFDVTMDFLPDDATPGLPPPPPAANPPAGLSIFGALQTLGLRLESAKGPVEVLVIDRVERPSAN